MKKMILTGIFALAALGFAGCQTSGTANTANASAGNNTGNSSAVKANGSGSTAATPAASPAAELPKTGLKPDGIDPNKPIPAAELKSAFLSDPNAWKGKEVSVIGKYHSKSKSTSNDGKLQAVWVNVADPANNMMVTCITDKDLPPDVASQRDNRVFKGKIERENMSKNVELKPCQFVK